MAALLGGRDQVFAICVVVLSAKLAKCDGPVLRAEIDAFKRQFRIPPEGVRNVGRLFDQARDSTEGFEEYARQLAHAFADNRGLLEDVLAALFTIARADKPLTVGEEAFLRQHPPPARIGPRRLGPRPGRHGPPRRRRGGRIRSPGRLPRRFGRGAAPGLEDADAREPSGLPGQPRRAPRIRRPRQRQGGPHQRRLGPHQAGTRALTPRVQDAPSPNQDDRPENQPVDMLILHYTGMQTGQAALDRLRDPDARVSSHYVIEEDGTVFRLVPETRRAFHAGVSYWRGHTALNGRSIGIEIVNPGHQWGYRAFPAAQMDAVRALCRGILSRHPIPPRNVVGHSDVAPDRKGDPGELFDWKGLAADRIGLWPDAVPDAGAAAGLGQVRRSLSAIGYQVAAEGARDAALATVLRAFQRHWRPEAVTGEADAETCARVAAMAARVARG